MKIKNLFLAAMTLFAFNACTYVPESPYAFPGIGENDEPAVEGENLLENSDFEIWEGTVPVAWGQTVTNSTYSQSTDAHSGSSAVLIEGYSSSNKRFASKSYTLKPGNYTLSTYIKKSGETLGQYRLGYAKLTNGVVADTQNDYIYITSATAVPTEWKKVSCNFTLEAETEIAINIMNSKYGEGAAILIDDVTLTTVDGGIVEGTEEDEPESGEFPEGTYISESFATSLGSFTTQQTVGDYPWVNDYSTAKATSYVNSADNAATSWLVSPAVDFTEESEAHVTFDYIIRYSESGKVAENHQLLISADYSGDVATASWTDMPYNAVEGSDWSTFYKANVNVPAEFLGKNNVTFALRYTATTKAGTWEVKNFVVAHGKAETTETPDTPENPGEAAEYTVAQALAAFVAGEAKPAVVKGYIVGSIDDKSISDANFSNAAVLKTNLLLADNADETDIAKCLAIQLPTGAVRDALNLVDNPSNYKKLVTLTGSLEKYFGVAGLKSVTKYAFDGETPENPGEEPENPGEEPETPVVPTEGNILENYSFEEWNGSNPTAWGEGNIGHKSTISQSTEAYDGNYAIVVNGSTQNMRLASKSYILPAGTYTIAAYIKQSGSTAGAFKLGYGIIKDGAIANSDYKYQTNATTVTSEWTLYTYEFTLSQETTIAALVMNSKVGNGAAILVDNVTITAN